MRDSDPPEVIGGRYTVGELIGRGGAADVHRAHDRLLGRDVAIKMFVTGRESPAGDASDGAPGAAGAAGAGDAGDGAGSGDAVGSGDAAGSGGSGAEGAERRAAEERHRREVLTLAGLSHPGLVTVYDVGDEGGRAYFVMQLIEGDTLARRIRDGALGVIDVVALGAALGDALAYVHRRGVVHRDVKPANVLLDAGGRAHLSDFGIASVHDAAPVTETGMVIGTASYLSPEQVRGEPVGPAVDVYALGLVLLECLTGRREYPGNALEAAVARLHRSPAIPPDLPGGLTWLLEAMTADDPAARPGAADVVGALRWVSREVAGIDAATVLSPVLVGARTAALGLGAHHPTASVPRPSVVPMTATPPAAPGTRAPRRHRRLLTLAVAGACALVLAGTTVAVLGVSARSAVPAAPQVGLAPELPVTSTAAPVDEPVDDETSEAPTEAPTETRSARNTTTTPSSTPAPVADTTTTAVPEPSTPAPAPPAAGPPAAEPPAVDPPDAEPEPTRTRTESPTPTTTPPSLPSLPTLNRSGTV